MSAAAEVERPLHFTRFADVQARAADAFVLTFTALAEALENAEEFATKGACPLFKLARFGDVPTEKGCLRHDGNLLAITGIEGEHDAGTMPVQQAALLLDMAHLRAFIYTSASHTAAAPRWRVLVPFSEEQKPSDRARMVARLNGVLSGALAPESFNLSQSFYYGRVKGSEYEFARTEGDPLDVRADLDEGAIYPAGQNAAESPPADDFTRAVALREVTDETISELRSAVAALEQARLDNREQWVDLCFALKSCVEAGRADDEIRELFHEMSRRSPKYDEADTDRVWDSARPSRLTYRSVFEWAAADGWVNPRSTAARFEPEHERSARIGREGERGLPTQRVMSGSEMLEELVYIADGARVSFDRDPRFVLPFGEFRQFAAGSVDTVQLPGGRPVKKHRLNTWAEHAERKTVTTQTFAPGQASVCRSPRNDLAQNLWTPRHRTVPEDWQTLAAPFLEHVAYLVPDAGERERFLDWLAHIEQAPGVLPSTHYLLVTPQTGIGRNWLAYALARAFAGNVALGFDLGASMSSGFNGELSQTLLAVVDELHEGGPSATTRPQAEKLKSLLTEATRRINPKFGRQHVEFNACRFLMFSNHEAALPLTESDRRVVVIQNPTERKPAAYYRELYALLDAEGLGDALAEALRRRDLSGFNPGEIAPMNDAKRRTIRAGRSEIEQAVRDLAAEWPSDCITSSRLGLEVTGALGGRSASTQGAGVAAGLVKFGHRVRVAGIAQHVWILRNPRDWIDAQSSDVAAEVLRGERGAPAAPRTASEVFSSPS